MTYAPRGFTLIETMVAITLLAVALIGPFIAVQNALQASYIARDQLVASQLAQEGVEYLRSIRDNNYFNNRAWLHFPYPCAGASPAQYCTVDPTRGDFHTASEAVNAYSQITQVPYLYVSSAGLYNQQGAGSATRFKRLVRVYTLSATESRIEVEVQWITSGKTYSVTVTDTLRDWI